MNNNEQRFLLKNGLIVDGTGGSPFHGNLLVSKNTIEEVSIKALNVEAQTMDCSGLVIAPGFIDMHSHMDWILPAANKRPDLLAPFTTQGVTTFFGGNCGFGIAGFRKNNRFNSLLELRTRGLYSLKWHSMAQYFDHLNKQGITHNLVNLAGLGSTRTSIRGFDPSPLSREEMKEMLYLLEEAMDQGARGVSLGLQYEPDVFATREELKKVAELVKRKNKILTVHLKAYLSVSGNYSLRPFGTPHNLRAIAEMISLARETEVKLQISHLYFTGARTCRTFERAMKMIDEAVKEGIDVKFDIVSYNCGQSVLNVIMPEWFLAGLPQIINNKKALLRLRVELTIMLKLIGASLEDIQIACANHPELNAFNGWHMNDIARHRHMSDFENLIDIILKTAGKAFILMHGHIETDQIRAMMKHSACLFATDATIIPEGTQNPGVYGGFPRFLKLSREYKDIALQEAVYKMTGAAAERFNVPKRGTLKKNNAADITVFDWNTVRELNSPEHPELLPDGIKAVFVNGRHVLREGKADQSIYAGTIL